MKILHYSLGIPGFRSGGLTKYSIDLMKEEVRLGNEVFLLYPGEIKDIKDTTYIKKNKDYDGINVFEIINPLPVSLVDGVKEPQLFYLDKPNFKDYAIRWISENAIDIVHIHTLMGLPIEFIKAVKEVGIKIIFTTHDYYGICPKVNLIRNDGSICNNNKEFNVCAECCRNGLSYNKIKIMQYRKYRLIKNFKLGKDVILLLKKYLRKNKIQKNNSNNITFGVENNCNEYRNLNSYYYEFFKEFDYYHFNSELTRKIYEKYLGKLEGKVIYITHGDIKDNRKIKKINEDVLKIVFLGNESENKGLNILLEAVKGIDGSLVKKWMLEAWGTDQKKSINNIIYKGKYKHTDLSKIFENSELIIIPSRCYETFGFVGLEAYSYAMPIISSNLVGFNELIKDNITGFIVNPDSESIRKKIIQLIEDKEKLRNINKNIFQEKINLSINLHAMEILKLYNSIRKE